VNGMKCAACITNLLIFYKMTMTKMISLLRGLEILEDELIVSRGKKKNPKTNLMRWVK
jgi:hypothetical protein